MRNARVTECGFCRNVRFDAAVAQGLGEPGFVAFSVVAALADAECRAGLVDLPGLAGA